MPSFIVGPDQRVFAGAYDISGELNAVALTASADLRDATTFGKTGRVRKGGLRSVTFQMEGFWASDTVDPLMAAHFGVADIPITVAAGSAEGAPAFMFRGIEGEFEWGGQIGDMAAFSAGAQSSAGEPLVRALVMHTGAETVTGSGTVRELAGVGATNYLYGGLHVLAVVGTLTVTIASDSSGAFATPAFPVSFVAATTPTSQWVKVPGPLTDSFYRVAWTITGGPATFVVTLGIQ